MNCDEVIELAPLYVCGDLDPGRAAEFDAHLKTCSACMFELRQHARLDARLREVVLSQDLETWRVNSHVREMIESGVVRPDLQPNSRRGARGWVIAAMGIAAVLLFLLFGYRLLLGARIGRVYADAAADHQREVVERLPRKWVVDPARIAALAERQGIEGISPEALALDGYHLQSARLCFLDRRVFLHLVYSNGAKEFSLYLRARDATSPLPGRVRETANGTPLHIANSGEEYMASFETERLAVVVVTTDSSATAMSLAHSLTGEL